MCPLLPLFPWVGSNEKPAFGHFKSKQQATSQSKFREIQAIIFGMYGLMLDTERVERKTLCSVGR